MAISDEVLVAGDFLMEHGFDEAAEILTSEGPKIITEDLRDLIEVGVNHNILVYNHEAQEALNYLEKLTFLTVNVFTNHYKRPPERFIIPKNEYIPHNIWVASKLYGCKIQRHKGLEFEDGPLLRYYHDDLQGTFPTNKESLAVMTNSYGEVILATM